MKITCRHCGRAIALSPVTGLWWPLPTEWPPPPVDHKHEPQEP